MSDDLAGVADEAAALIAASRHVVALVGAGMSAESGIPTFRGKEGIWTKHGEPDLRDYDRFREDPKGWWEQRMKPSPAMNELTAALADAVPNEGHFALKEMEDRGDLAAIITQNIDNMHQIAGSTRIIEIHGNRTKLRCTVCSHRWPLDEFPIDEVPPTCPDCAVRGKGDTGRVRGPEPLEGERG